MWVLLAVVSRHCTQQKLPPFVLALVRGGDAASGAVATRVGWSTTCKPLKMVEFSTGFLIPWACLMDREMSPNKKASPMPGQRKLLLRLWEIHVTFLCPN